MSEEHREYAEIIRLVWPDWEIVEKIGSGAFASVYRASRRDGITGEKDAAVKVIRIPNSDSDWDMALTEGKTPEQAETYFRDIVEDSLKEIRAMEELSGNTNIVSIFDYKVHKVPDRPVWYMLIRMEYLQKVDATSLTEEEIIRLGTDVCTALSICRKKNIVHRDVSLDNIFVHDGNYKLGDFGVAKVLEGTIGTMHTIAGKPLYMAPEVYNATLEEADIDSASKVDIYSLGILMYRLANQMRYPFEDPDNERITSKERNQAFKRRVIEGAELPAPRNASPELAAVILKACMGDPDKRYESADTMKEDLLSISRDRTSRQSRPIWKRMAWISAALAVLACIWFFALSPVLFPEWSAWSEWSETRREITDSEQTQEEMREEYEWTAVRCPVCHSNNHAGNTVCVTCKNPLPADSETVKQYSQDSASEVIDGEAGGRKFDGIAYWYSGTISTYRYRTRIRKDAGDEESAEEAFCHDWYYASYENSELYPGIVFTADGTGEHFSVTGGEKLFLIDSRNGQRNEATEASVEGNVLTAGLDRFTLEDGKLVCRYGPVTETYTRTPQEQQIPSDQTAAYADKLKPEHYNGTWTIVKYGTRNAFADAETMNMTGKAVIEDKKLTLTWTRDGQEKSFEITFDGELNKGRLYTVVNGSTSYIVSMLADHTVFLNVGLDESQWVMRKEKVISGETVYPEIPDFESAFAMREDWTATEETRNELARLLINAAVEGGADPAAIPTDGPFYLALMSGDAACPVLVCEGTGDYEYYLLSVGRGTFYETGEPFVYYHWTDYFFDSLRHPEETILEDYANGVLHGISNGQIWPVRIDPE